MVAGAADMGVPGLPVDKAAEALLSVNPVLGAVIIFEAAAICALAFFILKLFSELARSRIETVEAKQAHIADLKQNIPAIQELRETILSEMRSRSTRTRG